MAFAPRTLARAKHYRKRKLPVILFLFSAPLLTVTGGHGDVPFGMMRPAPLMPTWLNRSARGRK